MKYRYLAIIITIITIFFGCTEDFIDKKPLGVVSDETFFTTPDGPTMALMGCYNQLQYDSYSSIGIWVLGSVASDDAEAAGDNKSEFPDAEDIAHHRTQPTNGVCSDWYKCMYGGIFRCNTILENLPKAELSITEGLKKQILAEAKFLRAYYFFELTKVFGGVPLVDHVLQPSEYNQTRAGLSEVYKLIEKDLEEAAAELPDVNPGRASKGAAYALLAKTCLFESSYARNYKGDSRFAGLEEKWGKVIEYCNNVINSPAGYKLEGLNGEKFVTKFGEKTPSVKYIFSVPGNNCNESIFEIQVIYVTSENPWSAKNELGYSENFYGQGLRWCIYNQCRRYFDSKGVSQELLGWGFNVPSNEFIDDMNKNYEGDIRVKTWVAKEGDSVLIKGGPVKLDLSESPTNMHNRKFELHPDEFGSSFWQYPFDIRLIRLADVVLWAAEAELISGNEPNARKYVNMVRQRARLAGNTNKPEELAGPVTLENIMNERRIEFCFEGHRFYDLVRWGIAKQKIDGLKDGFGNTRSFETGKDEFFPIPASAIEQTGGTIKQNPGY